jgi:glucosamine-6-phosphate deaminase
VTTIAGTFRVDAACVTIHASAHDMGEAVAQQASQVLADAIAARGLARIIIGTGPSQARFIAALVQRPQVDWSRVEVFHMDEYRGMAASHPASFRRWLREHLVAHVHPGHVRELAGDAADPAAEAERYAALLNAAPVDLSCVGFGENGHLAFNDPHVADFADPHTVKLVTLDQRCRLQQVGEGHFPGLAESPAEALTVTLPALMRAATVLACVPDLRKAHAVRDALEGPVAPTCPASLVRTHPNAFVHLDPAAASLLRAPAGVVPGHSLLEG